MTRAGRVFASGPHGQPPFTLLRQRMFQNKTWRLMVEHAP